MINAFRWLGRFEGLSFIILLGIAMPLKYMAGKPEAVRIVGMAHGILFMCYVMAALYAAESLKWSKKLVLLSWIAAVLPFGTFIFEKRFLAPQRSDV